LNNLTAIDNAFSVITHLEGTLFADELPFGAATKYRKKGHD
jgi:hypothetical protein